MRAIFLILVVMIVPVFSKAQQELLDTSYGINGRAIVDFLDRDETRSTAIDDNDRLLIVGTHITTGNPNANLYVCRLTPDGQIDETFCQSCEIPGFFVFQPELVAGRWRAPKIKVLSSGKIIVGMSFLLPLDSPGSVTLEPHIIRLNADGTLDQSFGSNGVITLAERTTIECIAEDGNGVVYLANSIDPLSNDVSTSLVRISVDGQSVDEDFASEALEEVSSGYFSFRPSAMLVEDDRLVLVHNSQLLHPQWAWQPWPWEHDLVVWQYSLSANQLLGEFGNNGKFTYRLTQRGLNNLVIELYDVYDVVINGESNLLITLMDYGSSYPSKLLKVNSDGHLRVDYYDGGVFTFDYSASSCNKFIYFAKHPSNGYYLVGNNAGILDECATSTTSICQISDEGVPLTLSATNAGSIEVPEGFNIHGPMVQVQSDGNLLLTGFYFPYQENNDTDIKTVRILADMVSSVEESEETRVSGSELVIFPNPATTVLTVQLNFPEHTAPGTGIELVMHDLQGRIVYRQNHPELDNGEARFEVNHLPAGLYTLHCTVDGVWVDATKIVVE